MDTTTADTPFSHLLAAVVPALFRNDADLSRALGTSQVNVSRWRSGAHTPSMPMLVKLSGATSIAVETLAKIAAYEPAEGEAR